MITNDARQQTAQSSPHKVIIIAVTNLPAKFIWDSSAILLTERNKSETINVLVLYFTPNSEVQLWQRRFDQRGPSCMQVGNSLFGRHGDGRGSVAQQIHDGDTMITELDGNVSVRFLGIDTPEVSFILPNDTRFLSITNPGWEDFLTDPFTTVPQEFISNGHPYE